MYPEYIFLKCYIFREILGVFFIFFLYNQPKTKKFCESLPPPHFTIFTKIMYMYLYKEYYMEWGSWYKEGTMLQWQEKNLNASRGRYHICTEINRSLDNWLSIFV